MQVLFSLQSNAIKYTTKGEVRHTIDLIETDEGQFLKIDVHDTGLGIREEDRDKMFKLFGQVKNDKGLNQNGIGLGLVIIKKIVNQFGGVIDF